MKISKSRLLFVTINYSIMTFAALLCLLPLIHVAAISLSSSAAATAGMVKLWPVEFTTSSYDFVLKRPEFLRSMGVSFKRILLGGAINMFLIILTAYPLSKEVRDFKWR